MFFKDLLNNINEETQTKLYEFFRQEKSPSRVNDIIEILKDETKNTKIDITEVKEFTKKISVPKFSLGGGVHEFFRYDFHGSINDEIYDKGPLFKISGISINNFPLNLYLKITKFGMFGIQDVNELKRKLSNAIIQL
jgi:hypothetical protein